MNTSTVRFAYHLDRDYLIPFMAWYQRLFGIGIIPVHLVSFYLLIVHTAKWKNSIRTGYLLTQSIMFSHDVWTCFFFRSYVMLPNPIIMCAGIACRWLGPYNALTVEHFFMVHSVAIFQTLLLMQQQVVTLSSSYSLPKWSKMVFACFIYICLLPNGIVTAIVSGDVPHADGIIERQQLSWLSVIEGSTLLVLGEVGNCGAYRYEVYVIIVSIIFMIPIRYFLIGSSIRLLRKQRTFTSKATKIKARYISVLLRQTTILSVFYVYPLLFQVIAFRFQVDFLPEYVLAFLRCGGAIAYSFQSIPQFYLLISANKHFQLVLATKFAIWKKSNMPTINQFALAVISPER